MKKYVKAIALALALLLCLSFPVSVSAAEVADATIDTSRKGSFTIFKYAITGTNWKTRICNFHIKAGV